MQLLDLIDDILFIVFKYLGVDDILALRQTCKRLHDLSYSRAVWRNACNQHVILRNLPYPYSGDSKSFHLLDAGELERSTRHALRLHRNWTSAKPGPVSHITFKASASNIVSDVKFVLRRGHDWLITVSKGIWSVITCWDYADANCVRKAGEWMRKGALIRSVVVNSDPESDACLVVAYTQSSVNRVEINSIEPTPYTDSPNQKVSFTPIFSLDTNSSPISLNGDIIVLSDDFAETHLLEWKTGRVGILRATDEVREDVQHDKCLAVLFAHESVFVARARSLDLFPIPKLTLPSEGVPDVCYPLASYSFGWIDSVAMSVTPPEPPESGLADVSQTYPSISILLRAESDNPWSSNIHRLRRYMLPPNPLYTGAPASPSRRDVAEYFNPETGSYYDPACPYLFPPRPTAHVPALRGFLRCADVALGPRGSALWIQPRPRTARAGLTMIDPEITDQFVEQDESMAIVRDGAEGTPGAYTRGEESGSQFRAGDEVAQHLSPRMLAAGLRAMMVNFREECLCAAMFPGPLSKVERSEPNTRSNTRSGHSIGSSTGDAVNNGNDGAQGLGSATIYQNTGINSNPNTTGIASSGETPSFMASASLLRGRRLWVNTKEASWTSMDYDEGTGRIALGASDGCVTMLFM